MSDKSIDAFFYGLYMDAEVLRSLGIEPLQPRIARLDDHELDLRGAVKALPKPGARVWGIVYRLHQRDLEVMYGGPKTKQYAPGTLDVVTQDGRALTVGCYNQPEDPRAPLNAEYLEKLVPAMERAGLPAEYIREIAAKAP